MLFSPAPPRPVFVKSAHASNNAPIIISTHCYAALPTVLTPTSDSFASASLMIACHLPISTLVCSASGHHMMRSTPALWN